MRKSVISFPMLLASTARMEFDIQSAAEGRAQQRRGQWRQSNSAGYCGPGRRQGQRRR